MSKNSNKMWGGHFSSAPDEIMQAINASISFDKRLYAQDIQGSIAHAKMLAKQDILTDAEAKEIIQGLTEIKAEIEAGDFNFSAELEDIHMNIESRLRKKIGNVSGKLHTARSRNDQVALDLKLWCRDEIDKITELLETYISSLTTKATQNEETIISGYTHLQTAQPVTFAHHLRAYIEMAKRDVSRLNDCRKRLNECPLGAAALAGTSFPIDRDFTAKELGFDKPTANSLDSVSDRDFAIELMSVISLTALHLSRFAEEIVIWCSYGYKFIKLSDKFTTGSSIMPQKRNPDAAELVRAKTARIFANEQTLKVAMKGLTLAYSKDMQEDKEPVFDSVDSITLCLKAMIGMVDDMIVNTENMLHHAKQGYSTATDIADYLVRELNIPFRDSHHITGRIVVLAEEKNCYLNELSIQELQSVEPKIKENIFDILSVESSVKSRTSFGGANGSN